MSTVSRLAARGGRDAIDAVATDVEELPNSAVSGDPLGWPGYPEQLEQANEKTGQRDSAVAATGRIGDVEVVLVALDFGFMGGSMGEATGARIVAAFDEARRRRVPIITLLASGGARMQEGMRSLVQMQRIAAAVAAARAEGIPHIGVLRHPTTGGIWASLGAAADILLALPGATVAFAGGRVRAAGGADAEGLPFTAEGKVATGFVDAVLDEEELVATLRRAVAVLEPARRDPRPADVPRALGVTAGANARRGWASVQAARAPDRPRAQAYLDAYFDFTVAIRGDRVGGAAGGMLCGFGLRDGRAIAYAAQNGTATTPAGFRLAIRLLQLADRYRLPVLTLIDTPGAANDAEAERGGVATAIAETFQAVAASRVPITSLVVGEGGSGGALALADPAELWIVPDGYFGVIAPEGAAAILERDPAKAPEVAERMALSPTDLVALGVAKGIAAAA